ncbi:hypothetical protein [Rhodoflexus sp.]
MNDLNFIKAQLENPSLKRRRDFMETYDFPEQYSYFYHHYIRQNLQQAHKDNWYLIALIELAEDIGFFAADIPPILWRLYEQRRAATYLKLTILDYFLAYPIAPGEVAAWEKRYLKYLKNAQNPLIRCQLLVNLLNIGCRKNEYCVQLTEELQHTTDYHVIIRVVNALSKISLPSGYYHRFIKTIKQNPLATTRAVADMLAEN